MKVECKNKGSLYLVNGWAVGSNSKHIHVRLNSLRELMEAGVICISWVSTGNIDSGLHTKKIREEVFSKRIQEYTRVHVSDDKHWCQE